MQPISSLYEILKICVGMYANRRIAGGAPIHYVTIIFSRYFRGGYYSILEVVAGEIIFSQVNDFF